MIKKSIWALVLWSSSLFAGRYFIGDNVEVRVQAKNSFIAQQQAQSQALVKAFSKMLSSEFSGYFIDSRRFTTSEILSCVYDYSIDREKYSGKVFIGRFSFRFSQNKVESLLQKHGFEIKSSRDIIRVRLVALRNEFIKNRELMTKNEATIIKFNTDKVVFELGEQNLKNVTSVVRCVKL